MGPSNNNIGISSIIMWFKGTQNYLYLKPPKTKALFLKLSSLHLKPPNQYSSIGILKIERKEKSGSPCPIPLGTLSYPLAQQNLLKIGVKEHDIHIEPKSWKSKLLGNLVIQHGIRVWFDGRSQVQAASPQFAFPQFVLLDMNPNFVRLSTCRYRAAHEKGC